jgi:poly(A) polymerase
MPRFEALVGIETGALAETDPLLRLAALLPDDPAEGVGTAERLRLSNAERDRLEAALTPAPEIAPAAAAGLSPPEVRALVYRLGARAFRDRVKLAWAAAGGGRPEPWRGVLAVAEGWSPPVLPIGGADVLAAGAPKGPKVGEILRALEAWWIAGDFTADRAAALAKLRDLIA